MIRLSLSDKLEMLKDIIMSNSYLFIIFISFIVITILLFNTKKLDRDMLIKSCIGIYVIIIMCIVLEYKDTFYGIIDYLINDVFFNLLFPSIATYALTIIISNIIVIKSIFNKKTKKTIRKINILVYCFLSFILFLALNFIKSNNIDVYSSMAVYSNKELFVLIELNMGVFIIWLISLIIIKFIENKKAKDLRLQSVNLNLSKEIEQPIIEEVIENKNLSEQIDNNKIDSEIAQPNLNNINVSLNELNNSFTLEEYKLLSKMLKERQQ